jgi:hypothetical protein
MNPKTRVGLLAGAPALLLTSVSFADGAAESEVMKSRIAELEAKVAQMEQGDNWLTEERSEEIRGIVQDVLADADTRASLLSSGLQGGYDSGFLIGSTDGAFLLRINGHLQSRYMVNRADQGILEGVVDQYAGGFEVTRAKLYFSGHVGSPDWKYMLEVDFGVTGRSEGAFDEIPENDLSYRSTVVRDAYIQRVYDNGFNWIIGQFRVPLLREEMVRAQDQLVIERSMMNAFFTGGITQGLAVGYDADMWKVIGGITDGANGGGLGGGGVLFPPAATDPALTRDTEWSITGRGEFLFAGNWRQMEDMTSKPGEEMGLLVGVGGHYQNDEYGTAAPNEIQAYLLTVDGQFEYSGWSAFASFVWRHVDSDAAGSVAADQWGIMVQGAWRFVDQWEVYARWEYADPDTPSAFTSIDELNLITIGGNYYANDHMKISADFGYSINNLSSLYFDGRSYGFREDSFDQDGQFVLRAQASLDF